MQLRSVDWRLLVILSDKLRNEVIIKSSFFCSGGKVKDLIKENTEVQKHIKKYMLVSGRDMGTNVSTSCLKMTLTNVFKIVPCFS